MLKSLISFLRNYGFKQTLMVVLDRIFPPRKVESKTLPELQGEFPRFAVVDSLPDCVDPESAELVDTDGEWVLCGNAGDVRFCRGALLYIAEFLQKHPECGVLYFDSAIVEPDGKFSYELRPDFALEYLRSFDYCGKVIAVKSDFFRKYPETSNTDLMLRAFENGFSIGHLPQVLYTHRGEPEYVDNRVCVAEHLKRCGIEVESITLNAGCRRIKYAIAGEPLVSILIPSHNNCAVLKRCVDSIIGKCSWRNFEIVIVENGSTEVQLFDYYRDLSRDSRIKVVDYPVKEAFNYSRINNFGVEHCSGEYILFLNNDTEVITPGFLEEMLQFAQMPDVGVAGAKLAYWDGSLQHGGIIIGMGSIAAHHSSGVSPDDAGYLNTLRCAREFSAVTFACAVVRKSDFLSLGGLDETLGIAYNDVDFCLRMRESGKRVIFTPYAELFHHESLSRGREDTLVKQQRIAREAALFEARHQKILENGDPFYNPNLNLSGKSFSLRGRAGRLKLIQRKNRS
ncbi:MAG: glycosyltransferase [Lentisphaerae bacterium]|nr:glycosyltransferase [Lentisphaerota bacterium]